MFASPDIHTKARRWTLLLFLLSFAQMLSAQHRDVRLSAEIEKEWKLGKKLRFSVGQQLQLTPDMSALPWLQSKQSDADFADISFLDPVFICDTLGTMDGKRTSDEGDDDEDDDEDDDQEGDDEEDDDEEDEEDDDNDDDEDNGSGNGGGGNGGSGNGGGSPTDTDDDEQTFSPLYHCYATDSTTGGGLDPEDQSPWIELRSATSASLVYRFNKTFRLSAGYRYNLRPGTDTHIGFVEMAARTQTPGKRLTLDSRLRAFHETGFTENGWRGRNFATLRSRFTLRLGQIEPFTEAEIVYRIDAENGGFNRYRFAGGLNYRIGEDHRIRLQYIHQQRFNSSSDGRSGSFSLGYAFEL